MYKDIPEYIQDIIHALLNDSIEPAQEDALKNWLDDNPENLKLLEQYISFHNKIKLSGGDMNTGHHGDWKYIQKQIRSRNQRILRRKLLQYAAAFITLITVVAGYWALHKTGVPPTDKKASYDQLGTLRKNQAILKLSTGKNIKLSDAQRKNLHESNGTLIEVDTSNFLQYRRSEIGEAIQSEPLYNTLSIPRTGKYKVTLSDSTVVWLNSETTLKYPVHFSENERLVELEGEAYFEIAPDTESRFIVKTADMRIVATGTSFNVMAYQNERNVAATLLEGAIDVYSKNQHVSVKPGSQAAFKRDENELSVRKVNTECYTSWIHDVFKFNNTELRQVAKRLHRWYNIKITFKDTIAPKMRFSGAIEKNESIQKLFDIMQATEKINLTLKEKEVVIQKK